MDCLHNCTAVLPSSLRFFPCKSESRRNPRYAGNNSFTTGANGQYPNTEATEPAEEANSPATESTEEQDTPATEPAATEAPEEDDVKVLVAYFSATGTTEKLAEYAADATGADLYEIQPEKPYTAEDLDYGDSDSRSSVEMDDPDARPAISGSVENMEQYDIVIIGYPNWWASIPMPIASFLEEYDFSGKTIVPFCSHGGGRFGQSLTAIAKLAPNAELGEGLSVHYSGGSSLPDDIAEWLEINGLKD